MPIGKKVIKEETLCTYKAEKIRLQLVKLFIKSNNKYFHYETQSYEYYTEKYEVRLNRKIIDSSLAEYPMRKVFATYCQNMILQLKIY